MGLNHQDKDPDNTARQYRRIDRIIQINQERTALQIRDNALADEKRQLVRENEEDEWKRQDSGGRVVSLDEWRNRQRYRVYRKSFANAA